MSTSHTSLVCGLVGLSLCLGWVSAQNVPPELVSGAPAALREQLQAGRRTIRRDVPLTNAIRRAFWSGTRDFTGRPGPNYWQLQTDYAIEARLDRESRSIFGEEKIVVHNHSPDELSQLVLRLDHNIFRPRIQRGSSVPAELTDGMVVTRLAVDGLEADLSRESRRRDPEVLSVRGLTQTVAVVSLVDPIAPGGRAEVEIAWHTKLPGGDTGRGHRMTQRWGDHLFQPTQWFPRLAKYDDMRGWDQSVYLGPAEFYNNFGRFDVRIDVPAGWIVTATGVLQNPEEVLTETARQRLARVLDSDAELVIVGEDEVGPGKATAAGDRLVWHYVAELVNDFAWATAANYVWKATRATIPGKGPIPIYMVHLPERANRFRRAGQIARHALEFYSELWVPYPFPQLTMQDGPSAGMEYPMVINSNQGAADHEVAHQWWPMMLGTNETMYGWMDEGLNGYMNILSRAHSRGREPGFDGRGRSYGQVSGSEAEPPMMWNSNYGGPRYGFQTYRKAPQMLSMLGGVVGDEEVQRAIRGYTEAWAFKHPSPWDFVFYMSAALDRDLGWFWYYWLWTTDSVDGRIEAVSPEGDSSVVMVHQDGQMPSPVVLKFEFVEDAQVTDQIGKADNVELQEDGSAIVTWPVDVWFDGQRAFAAEVPFRWESIDKVTLDPAGRFPDRDASDNVWPRQ